MKSSANGLALAAAGVVLASVAIVVGTQRKDDPRVEPKKSVAPHKVEPRRDPLPTPDVGDEEPVEQPTDHTEPVADTSAAPAHLHLRKLIVKNPSDVIEVLVVKDGKPQADLRVRVRAATAGAIFDSLEPAQDERIAFSDGEGLARFEKVEPGRYMIGIETRDNGLFTTYETLREGKSTARQIVALGRCGVEGRIWDRDAHELGNSRVIVTLNDPPAGAARLFAAVRTDAHGAYVVNNLPRGKGRVYCELKRCIDFALADGQIARADFGSASPPVAWSGGLVFPSGASCSGFSSFVASDSVDGEGYAIAIDESAHFKAQLPPGKYRAWLPCDPAVELGEVELAGATRLRDLVVPAVCVTGRLSFVGTRECTDEIDVTLQRAGDDASKRSVRVKAGERYAFAGLESGKWLVTTEPLALLGARRDGLEVSIDGSRERVALDLLVSDP